MPGAWEILESSSVLVGILHVDNTTMAWSMGFRNLQIPGAVLGVAGMPYDHARNEICKKALELGVEHVFMLDSDVIPPSDAILRLIRHRQPIISGVYCRRSPPAGVPVMIKDGKWVTEYAPNALIEVDLVGAGCLLIHRTVLESMPPSRPGKPWFDWRVDMKEHLPANTCLSEDFVFCSNARAHGYKILVDCGIQCKHVGYAQASFGSFVPLETTPVT